jgi:hypothetical protein
MTQETLKPKPLPKPDVNEGVWPHQPLPETGDKMGTMAAHCLAILVSCVYLLCNLLSASPYTCPLGPAEHCAAQGCTLLSEG